MRYLKKLKITLNINIVYNYKIKFTIKGTNEIQKVLNPNINRNSIVGFKVFRYKLESSETIS